MLGHKHVLILVAVAPYSDAIPTVRRTDVAAAVEPL